MEQLIKKRGIQSFLMKNEKYLNYIGWTIFALIGLLQMFKAKGGFITNYGADIIAPMMLYYSTRVNKTLLSKLFHNGIDEKQTFIVILSLCIIWEIIQRFDLAGTIFDITKGKFDFFDLLTYTLTLLLCFYFDITRVRANIESNPQQTA